MQNNLSYENHRPPVREEVQLQDKVAESSDVRFKLTETISKSKEDETNCSTFNTRKRLT